LLPKASASDFDHDEIRCDGAAVGDHRPHPVAADVEAQRPPPQERGAGPGQVLGQRLHQPLGIDRMADIGIENADLDLLGERRLQLPDLSVAQNLEPHAAAPFEVQLGPGGAQRLLAPHGDQVALPADQIRRPRRVHERRVGVESTSQEIGQGLRDRLDPRGCARPHETRQPGQQLGQVSPADPQRGVWIQQHPRHPAQGAGHGDRRHVGEREQPGITAGSLLARGFGIDHRHLPAVPAQVEAGRDADRPGADHRRSSYLGHLRLPLARRPAQPAWPGLPRQAYQQMFRWLNPIDDSVQ
jgi:hypothetical protein